MSRIIIFMGVGAFLGLSSESFAAENCAKMAQKAANLECLRLCPTACREPLNRVRDQSESECQAACIDSCNIGPTDEITAETPWIKAEALRDYANRKNKCDGNTSGNTPQAWRSVDPARTDTLP